jgi:protein TonB
VPHDLFGDVASRSRSVRSRQTPVVLVSLVVHAAAVLALLVVSLAAADALPTPRFSLGYYDATSVRMMDIKLPDPPPRAPAAPRLLGAPPTGAAPVVAPTGILPETGFEGASSSGASPEVLGVERGAGIVEGVGLPEVTPPPPPPALAPVRLHSGIQAPRKIVDVAPVYPAIAQISRKEGVVILETVIDEAGRVTSARVLRSVQLLDDAALEAVRQWRFTPALLNGIPVPVVMTVTVQFTLRP